MQYHNVTGGDGQYKNLSCHGKQRDAFVQMQRRGRPKTHRSAYCYHPQFGRSALKSENPRNWGALELRSLGMGGDVAYVADPKIHASHPHVKYGGSVTKGVRIYRRGPQKLGSAGTQSP